MDDSYKHFAQNKTYNQNTTDMMRGSKLDKKTWSTRLDEETEREIKVIIKKSGLKEAEVLRRLIVIGLRNVKEPADLLKI